MHVQLHLPLLITFLFCLVNAKLSTGVIKTTKNWAYIDRFCFKSEEGKVQYFLRYPASYGVQTLLIYYDEDTQWKAAYDENKNCSEKEDLLDPDNNQILRLNVDQSEFAGPDCYLMNDTSEEWVYCSGTKSFASRRARWWYFALSNCDSTEGMYLDYSMLLTNADGNNRWFHHFSFDEFYAMPITITYMVIDAVIFFVSIIFASLLSARKMLHRTFKVYLNSVILEFMCLVCLWLHYDRYAADGIGFPLLRFAGLLLRQSASALFFTLLLLISKGFTITRGKITAISNIKVTVFFLVFLIGHHTMLIWQYIVFDPAKVTYMSESIPAYINVVVTVIGWLCYVRWSFTTVNKYPTKFRFYLLLGICITPWFFAGAIGLVIANFVLDNWVRYEVMLGLESGVMLYGFAVFLILTCPLPDNSNFPYHVRTNQIDQGNFPQNVYEVQYSSETAETAVVQ